VTFGDSVGDRSGFTTDLSNFIMVNIEELSEEDQRMYTELQGYMKHQFLSAARKDRSGKVTMTREFDLSAIKVNNDKIEVSTVVSESETDLSMKLTELSDKFERAFSNQHSKVATMFTRLEKVEGKNSSFNFPNDSMPQLVSQGVLQTNLSATLCMACRLVLIRDNNHCQSRSGSDRPPWPIRPPCLAR
jgi:hypothetical protein